MANKPASQRVDVRKHIKKIVKLRSQGKTVEEIANEISIHRQYVVDVLSYNRFHPLLHDVLYNGFGKRKPA